MAKYRKYKRKYGKLYHSKKKELGKIRKLKELEQFLEDIDREINLIKSGYYEKLREKEKTKIRDIYYNKIEACKNDIDNLENNAEKTKPILGIGGGKIKSEVVLNKIEALKNKKSELSRELYFATKSGEKIGYSSYTDLKDFENIRKLVIPKINKVKNTEKEKAKVEKEKAKVKDQQKIIAGYQGKSREVAKSIKDKLNSDHSCPYCGGSLGEQPHADHIYPISKGGFSTLDNMILVCEECNIKKKDLTLQQFLEEYNLDRDKIEKVLKSLGKAY